jgi:hypothetical protein
LTRPSIASVAALCLTLVISSATISSAPARAATGSAVGAATDTHATSATGTATAYVDGISDQSLPAWDGDFADSYFGRLFSAVWVNGGHIRLARYVAQWDLMNEYSGGADAHGDYHEKFEAWLTDVGELGLVPEIGVTSYDGSYPAGVQEYLKSLRLLLDRARAMGHPVQYVEAWNEPNNQGAQTAHRAAQLTNSAARLCAQGEDCTVVAGNLEDSPDVAGYEREYERALDFRPAIWGVHPYYSVELQSQAPLENFIENLPLAGAGARIWFTEIAARRCTDYQGQLRENGAGGQVGRARWLLDTLMPAARPEHVFYFGFLAGERRQPSCASEREDVALYEPSGDAWAPDVPRPAASYVWGRQAGELSGSCGEPLSFPGGAGDRARAVAWPGTGGAGGWSLSVLIDGCTTQTGNSTSTFLP